MLTKVKSISLIIWFSWKCAFINFEIMLFLDTSVDTPKCQSPFIIPYSGNMCKYTIL